MDLKVVLILCAILLTRGYCVEGQRRQRWKGLSIGGLFFKLFPAIENPDVRAETNRKVQFYLYDRVPSIEKVARSPKAYRRDYRAIDLKNMNDMAGMFNTSLPTTIFIHGFMETQEPNVITDLISKMKETGRMNIMLVDWHTLSAGPWYPWAVMNVPAVGKYLAYFLDNLAQSLDVSNLESNIYSNSLYRRKRFSSNSYNFFKNLHLVGFSLGAHVAGIAGHHVTMGRIGRITGIEPAFPMVDLLRPKTERLDSSDAKFVDVIHSCSGRYGMPGEIGHVDFYPNGGVPIQPGCENVLAKYSCSHWKAWSFFAESVLNEKSFESVPCRSWSDFEEGMCTKSTDSEPVYMGMQTRRTARGTYYLRTGAFPPYSIPL